VLDVADHLRINGPGIGEPGSAGEIGDGSGNGTLRDKITGFGRGPDRGEDSAGECLRECGNQVAESVKRQGNSIFDRPKVHSDNRWGK